MHWRRRKQERKSTRQERVPLIRDNLFLVYQFNNDLQSLLCSIRRPIVLIRYSNRVSRDLRSTAIMTTCYTNDISIILQMNVLTIGCLAFSRLQSNQSEFPIHFITRGNLTTFEYFSKDQSLRY